MRLQVKVQTVPGYAKGLTDGMPKVIAQEGAGGCALMRHALCSTCPSDSRTAVALPGDRLFVSLRHEC